MNTGDERSREPPPDYLGTVPAPAPNYEILNRGSDAAASQPVDESAAALESRLQKELDGRQEDRFYGLLIGTVLLDIIAFEHLPWVGIICVFLLQLVILLAIARRLGSEHITILLDYLFYQLCEKIGLGPKK